MRITPVTPNITFGTKKQFKKMFNTCCYSRENFEPRDTKTIEHIIPLSQGGKNEYGNYLIVKRTWNQKKSAMPLKDFIKKNPDVKDCLVISITEQEGKVVDGVNWAEEVKKTLQTVLGEDIFSEKK